MSAPDLSAGLALARTVLLARDFVPSEVPDEVIVGALRRPLVTLIADEANLDNPPGQTLLVTLCQLVVASGADVRLAIPETPLCGPQPPITGSRLRAGLVALGRDLLPGPRVTVGHPRSGDVVFVIGDSRAPGNVSSGWRVWARSWSGGIAPIEEPAPRCRGLWTLGASAAAPIAAAEVFKAALRPIARRIEAVTEQIAPAVAATLSLAPESFEAGDVDLGDIDFVSGGAINSSALHALLRAPRLKARARVIEPEVLELTNLNRYLLARLSRVGWLKVEAIMELATPAFEIRGIPARFQASTAASFRPLAPTVIVGVDDIPSRWVVQREWPRSLIVGGTVHFCAVVSDHDTGPGCAGCLHPTDDGVVAAIPTAAFVSYLAGVLVATRAVLGAAGVRLDHAERAIELATLRLDRASAVWRHPVRPHPKCPVGCNSADGTPAREGLRALA